MGNLLGQPGEFYAIVTSDSSSRGMALERLQQEAQRVLARIAAGSRTMDVPRKAFGAMLHGIGHGMRAAVEAGDYTALDRGAVLRAAHADTDVRRPHIEEEEALGFAFMHSPPPRAGTVVCHRGPRTGRGLQGTALLEIDALLGLYFLSRYRERPSKTRNSVPPARKQHHHDRAERQQPGDQPEDRTQRKSAGGVQEGPDPRPRQPADPEERRVQSNGQGEARRVGQRDHAEERDRGPSPRSARPERMLIGSSCAPVRARAMAANRPANTRDTNESRTKLLVRLQARAQMT